VGSGGSPKSGIAAAPALAGTSSSGAVGGAGFGLGAEYAFARDLLVGKSI